MYHIRIQESVFDVWASACYDALYLLFYQFRPETVQDRPMVTMDR